MQQNIFKKTIKCIKPVKAQFQSGVAYTIITLVTSSYSEKTHEFRTILEVNNTKIQCFQKIQFEILKGTEDNYQDGKVQNGSGTLLQCESTG